jgi:hypothetical protein
MSLVQALVLGPLPLMSLASIQDWYVDVNAPSCGTGTGTQADPFCDVMDAVAAAADGDTIHIAPGTYYEHVVLDKDLELIGTGGDQVTILDGSSSGRVVEVPSAAAVTLTGLTLTNGRSVGWPGSPPFSDTAGGLFSYFGSVLLMNSTVTGNSAIGYPLGCCGGTGKGGGVYSMGGDLTLIDSTVGANYSDLWGGGIECVGTDLRVIDSKVTANRSRDGSPGIFFDGGGMSSMTIANTTISGNTVTGPVAYSGGAVTCLYGAAVIMTSSLINDNAAGSGVELRFSSTALIVNSIVERNDGTGISVGPWFGADDSTLTLINSTITSNSGAGIRVGVPSSYYPSAQVENSILWNNGSSLVVGQYATASVSRSLVEGGWPGAGNLDVNPLFVDSLGDDYRLRHGSPCIDAGDNSAVPLGITTDILGLPRFTDDRLTRDTGVGAPPVVDMGAHEGSVLVGPRARRP